MELDPTERVEENPPIHPEQKWLKVVFLGGKE